MSPTQTPAGGDPSRRALRPAAERRLGVNRTEGLAKGVSVIV
jgi:hypothetical protein